MPERLKPINLQHFTLYEIRTCGLIHVFKIQRQICFSSGFVLLPLLLGAGMCRHSNRRRNRESIGEYLYRLVGLANNIKQSIAHLSRWELWLIFYFQRENWGAVLSDEWSWRCAGGECGERFIINHYKFISFTFLSPGLWINSIFTGSCSCFSLLGCRKIFHPLCCREMLRLINGCKNISSSRSRQIVFSSRLRLHFCGSAHSWTWPHPNWWVEVQFLYLQVLAKHNPISCTILGFVMLDSEHKHYC